MKSKGKKSAGPIRNSILAIALAGTAGGAQAAHFIYTGGHGLDDERLDALGHTYTYACFPQEIDDRPAARNSPQDFSDEEACWNAVLAGEYGPFDAIVFGEGGYVPSEAVGTAIRAYLNGGGKFVVVDDHHGQTDFYNNDLLLATEAVYQCKDDDSIAATITDAAAGTSFANGPNELRNASCTSALATSSLPEGAKTFYAGESDYYGEVRRAAAKSASPQTESAPTSLAWANTFGTGTLVGLGWDFCCGESEQTEDDWYMVMDSALRYKAFTGSANLRLGFSGPAGQVRANTTAVVYARLDNYGRDAALNPVVDLYVGSPVREATATSTGWTCVSNDPKRSGTIASTPPPEDGLSFQCRANAGTMARGSLLFKIQLTTPTRTSSGYVSISGVASSDSIDPVPSNNEASFKLNVKPAASVAPVLPPIN